MRSVARRARLFVWVAALGLVASHAEARRPPKHAPPPPAPSDTPPPADDATQGARREFLAATDFVRDARWGEALAAFERSAKLRPHPLTTYNVGACERALGQYARARESLRAALADNDRRGGKELAESIVGLARDYLAEIDRIVAHVDVTLVPADAELSVDGQPLRRSTAEPTQLVAGGRTEGPAVRAPGARFSFVTDPGAHVFSVDRAGFARAAVSRSFGPGEHATVRLDLARLPATLRVSANEPLAVVTVGGLDVGVAPVQITRPAGIYQVVVRKPGYVAYSATVDLKAGQETNLRGSLVPETKPLYAKPWFWAAAVVVVGGAAATTYALTRPAPQAPPPDGGGLGWVVPVGSTR